MSTAQEYYPGSREKRGDPPSAPPDPEAPDPLGTGQVKLVAGRAVEMFTIGQLAAAIGRKPVTLRRWEAEGILPTPRYRYQSPDPRGRRRLYTREQAEAIIRIAQEEGVAHDPGCAIRATQFTERVTLALKEAG